MSLVQLKSAGLHYGPQVLLEGATVILSSGERVCLVGRNGEGKSSLLKLVAGEIQPDRGEVSWSTGCRVSVLEQHLPENPDISVYRHVAGGLGRAGDVLADYLEALQQGEDTGTLHERMDALDAWPLMTGSATCPVAGSAGPAWAGPWLVSRICCCWMSRPTTLILRRSRGLKSF